MSTLSGYSLKGWDIVAQGNRFPTSGARHQLARRTPTALCHQPRVLGTLGQADPMSHQPQRGCVRDATWSGAIGGFMLGAPICGRPFRDPRDTTGIMPRDRRALPRRLIDQSMRTQPRWGWICATPGIPRVQEPWAGDRTPSVSNSKPPAKRPNDRGPLMPPPW